MFKRAMLMACAAPLMVACATSDVPSDIPDVAASSGSETPAVADGAVMDPIGAFAAFEPQPSGSGKQIDYSIIDDALDLMVFSAGSSTRKAAPSRSPEVGTRIVRGHESRLRLEGNKVFFSQFDRDTIQAMRGYTDSLIQIGNNVEIASLNRNDQLAYWFNLHNMLVVTLIAENYPAQKPRRIKLGEDKVAFHEAKVATIDGVALSLRDIRENVVYRFWNDPRVIYGFFHGDLASPNIRRRAWTGENVSENLNYNAREFVNALRGVSSGRQVTYVSPMYFEARAGLFPSWPTDLRTHLAAFADPDVKEILDEGKEFRALGYEDRTADFVGGEPASRLSNVQSTDPNRNYATSAAFAEMTREYGQKFQTLRKQGKLRSRVIIVDIDTDDDQEASSDIE